MEHDGFPTAVIATSLPAIAADDIGTSAGRAEARGHLLSRGARDLHPDLGWMADRFGASPEHLHIAIVVFVLGSIACAFAGSLEGFVIARFPPGHGGFDDDAGRPIGCCWCARPSSELVSAMAWLTIPALDPADDGPPLGGFLTTHLSWHLGRLDQCADRPGCRAARDPLPCRASRRRRGALCDLPGFLLSASPSPGSSFGMSVVSLPALPLAHGWR